VILDNTGFGSVL